ncbi:MAG: HAD hydrolase-like protein [Acidobacteriota bacterium]
MAPPGPPYEVEFFWRVVSQKTKRVACDHAPRQIVLDVLQFNQHRHHRPAQECVMVGNKVQMDILPARRAGMKTFWITDAGSMATDVPADWRDTLADLGALVESGELAD